LECSSEEAPLDRFAASLRPQAVLLGHHALPGWSARVLLFLGNESAGPLVAVQRSHLERIFDDTAQATSDHLTEQARGLSVAEAWGLSEEDCYWKLRMWDTFIVRLLHLGRNVNTFNTNAFFATQAEGFDTFNNAVALAAIRRHRLAV